MNKTKRLYYDSFLPVIGQYSNLPSLQMRDCLLFISEECFKIDFSCLYSMILLNNRYTTTQTTNITTDANAIHIQ